VYFSVLRYIAVWYRVLQSVADCCSCCSVARASKRVAVYCSVLQCIAVYCNVLQFVAVYCRVSQSVAEFCSVLLLLQCCVSPWNMSVSRVAHVNELQCSAVYCSVLQCVAVRCSALQCVPVYCSILQSVAVCC